MKFLRVQNILGRLQHIFIGSNPPPHPRIYTPVYSNTNPWCSWTVFFPVFQRVIDSMAQQHVQVWERCRAVKGRASVDKYVVSVRPLEVVPTHNSNYSKLILVAINPGWASTRYVQLVFNSERHWHWHWHCNCIISPIYSVPWHHSQAYVQRLFSLCGDLTERTWNRTMVSLWTFTFCIELNVQWTEV